MVSITFDFGSSQTHSRTLYKEKKMLNSMRQNSYFAFQIFKVKSILPFIKLSQNFFVTCAHRCL